MARASDIETIADSPGRNPASQGLWISCKSSAAVAAMLVCGARGFVGFVDRRALRAVHRDYAKSIGGFETATLI